MRKSVGPIVTLVSVALALFAAAPLAQLDARGAEDDCLSCHSDLPAEPLKGSVHQELLCTSCHPGASEEPHRLPVTSYRACTSCHPSAEPYWVSVHGRDFQQGVEAVPNCADCHGSHQIVPVDSETSRVYPTHLPKTCGQCHENSALSERFGVPSERYTTYVDSYHGISLQHGNVVAANCSSCHGSHLILSASDPDSSIHPDNLPETCGQCHPHAGENFTRGKVHVQVSPGGSTGVWTVRLFYTSSSRSSVRSSSFILFWMPPTG